MAGFEEVSLTTLRQALFSVREPVGNRNQLSYIGTHLKTNFTSDDLIYAPRLELLEDTNATFDVIIEAKPGGDGEEDQLHTLDTILDRGNDGSVTPVAPDSGITPVNTPMGHFLSQQTKDSTIKNYAIRLCLHSPEVKRRQWTRKGDQYSEYKVKQESSPFSDVGELELTILLKERASDGETFFSNFLGDLTKSDVGFILSMLTTPTPLGVTIGNMMIMSHASVPDITTSAYPVYHRINVVQGHNNIFIEVGDTIHSIPADALKGGKLEAVKTGGYALYIHTPSHWVSLALA